jgi:transcriptional regulator with XRE-family HTH domain
MLIYDRIKQLCKDNGVTVTGTEAALGFSRGSLCKIDKNKPSIEKVSKLADYLHTTSDYIMTGENNSSTTEVHLNSRDEKDIKTILLNTEQLLKQPGLMFEGHPASQESIDSILSAMQVGMEIAKKKNKELYTPNKYKKEQ